MAQIVTITNPLTGQPAQVDQLEHTAQQIDDAIARALPGGAIDTALQKKVNPNILDDWYLGNPVDQRQGRVVKPNTTYYSDNQLTTSAGTTSAYVTAYRYATGKASGVNYASFKLEDSDTATTYYAAPENVVRGYTGAGYGIDRWKLLTSQCTVTIDNDGITLHRNGGDQWIYAQPLEPEFVTALTGKSVVISTLTDAGLVELPVSSAFTAEQSVVSTSGTCIWLSTAGYLFLGTTADSVKLKAAKLELGTTQTLAHQENGVWVLNEIPDYGEQLARCQRYCLVIGSDNAYCPLGTGQARTTSNFQLHIPLAVSLRTYPTVTKIGSIWVRNQDVVICLASLNFQNNLSQNCISLECSGNSAFTPGTFYESFAIPGGKLIISADL